MVVSMTGFGRGKAENEGREVVVELKTLNHRYLDINIKLPRVLSFLEDELRKILSSNFIRGRIELYISYKNKSNSPVEVTVNETLAEAFYKSFDQLSRRFPIKGKLDYQTLLEIPDLFVINQEEEDEDILRQIVVEALNLSIQSTKKMREDEEINLANDILKRNDNILEIVNFIEERAPFVVQEYKEKLENRIKELISSTDLDENRFNAEVAFFADKSNITEEIVRLKSHVKQLANFIKGGGSIGRKLDFLVQEMNREANTISSKSSDLPITNAAVEMKSEIEKIREQIQNIE